MKKKLIAVSLAAILAVALLPALAFAQPSQPAGEIVGGLEVNGEVLESDGDGVLIPQDGDGWTYEDGTLTLEDYVGGGIVFDSPDTLKINIKGENEIDMEGGDGIYAEDGILIFQGDGTLDIGGMATQPAIYIDGMEGSKAIFDLSPGGQIHLDPVEVMVELQVEHPAPWDLPQLPAIHINGSGAEGEFGSLDMLTLNPNNFIVLPEGGKVEVYQWDVEDIPGPEILEEATPEEPVATAKAQNTMTTITTPDDGLPAYEVTIIGRAEPENPAPTPTPASPAGTVAPAKTPKTGDSNLTGLMVVLMVAGAAAMSLGKRKFD